MTNDEHMHIALAVSLIVTDMRTANPRLTPGEIYDAIAAELEKRCLRTLDSMIIARKEP